MSLWVTLLLPAARAHTRTSNHTRGPGRVRRWRPFPTPRCRASMPVPAPFMLPAKSCRTGPSASESLAVTCACHGHAPWPPGRSALRAMLVAPSRWTRSTRHPLPTFCVRRPLPKPKPYRVLLSASRGPLLPALGPRVLGTDTPAWRPRETSRQWDERLAAQERCAVTGGRTEGVPAQGGCGRGNFSAYADASRLRVSGLRPHRESAPHRARGPGDRLRPLLPGAQDLWGNRAVI